MRWELNLFDTFTKRMNLLDTIRMGLKIIETRANIC